MRLTSSLFCAMLCLPLLAACAHHHRHHDHATRAPVPVVVERGGPPPHAPAHGYRAKHHHDGVDLVFDSRLGVYVVIGLDRVYFHADHFFRFVEGGGWQVSVHANRDWRYVDPAKVPPGLTKGSMHSRGRGKGKGPHPAKHAR